MRKLMIGIGVAVLALLAAPAMAAHGDSIPDFTYNPANGQLTVNTDALNAGTYEGLYTMLVTSSVQALSVTPTRSNGTELGLSGPGSATLWQGDTWHQAWFNGKEQWVNAGDSVYLNTGGSDLLFATYATGLSASAFASSTNPGGVGVEYGAYIGGASNTYYTEVNIVPEPGTLTLLAMAGVAAAFMTAARRRRVA